MSRMGTRMLLKHYRLGKCERKYSRTSYQNMVFGYGYGNDYLLFYSNWIIGFNKHEVTLVHKQGPNLRKLSENRFAFSALKNRIAAQLSSLDVFAIDFIMSSI